MIGSIYGPNSDTPEFYTELGNTINLFIIGGDWNSTRDFNKDNLNYARINNPKSTEAISHMCTHFNLVDAWRIKNPTKKQYTWLQGLSNKQSRLDYFLITEELLSAISEDKIGTKYRSDHAPVYLTFTLSNHIRGPGTWKLNNSLLLDEEFIILIKKEINNFKLTYAATPYNPDFVTAISHNFELMISASLFWETLLVTLRGIIIRYSRKKKRDRNRARKVLETEIEE